MPERLLPTLVLFAGVLLTGALTGAPAAAAEIVLLSSVGVKAPMETVLPEFAHATAHHVTARYGTAASIKTRIDGGEAFDVALLDPRQIADLLAHGKARDPVDLARAGVAFGLRSGAPAPDLSTDDKLRAYLLGVRSIAHSDPAQGGFSVTYFRKVVAPLGLVEILAAKTKFTGPGEGGTLVASGDAELGVGMTSELAPVAGVTVIPFRADDPASFIDFTAAIATNADDADAARALLAFLRTPAVKEVFRAQGLTTR